MQLKLQKPGKIDTFFLKLRKVASERKSNETAFIKAFLQAKLKNKKKCLLAQTMKRNYFKRKLNAKVHRMSPIAKFLFSRILA